MPVLLAEKIIDLTFEDMLHRRPITRPDQPLSRAPGVHASGILSYIAHRIGILKPGEFDEEDPGHFPLIWALGQAWEEYIFSFYPHIVWQPGEWTEDNISRNCDGLNPEGIEEAPDECILEEAKLTYKGVATGEDFIRDPKWWLWRMQGADYCGVYGTRVERWHVCHVRGDYKKFGPVYRQYIVRYSDREVEQVREMMVKHREFAKAEG